MSRHFPVIALSLFSFLTLALGPLGSAEASLLRRRPPPSRPTYQLGLTLGSGLAFLRSDNPIFQNLESQPFTAGLVTRSSAERLQLELGVVYQHSFISGALNDPTAFTSVNIPLLARFLAPKEWGPLPWGIGLGFERRFFVNRAEGPRLDGWVVQEAVNVLPVSLLTEWYLSHENQLTVEIRYQHSLDSFYKGGDFRSFDELMLFVTLLQGF